MIVAYGVTLWSDNELETPAEISEHLNGLKKIKTYFPN